MLSWLCLGNVVGDVTVGLYVFVGLWKESTEDSHYSSVSAC